jgi:hypothetical protein
VKCMGQVSFCQQVICRGCFTVSLIAFLIHIQRLSICEEYGVL